jgi:hypothetical protein
MKLFKLHPDDARWLCRWMRSNLVCVLAILCFLAAIRNESPVPFATMRQVQADQSLTLQSADLSPDVGTAMPPETELVLLDSRRPNPVAPEGWRRTDQGWEHVSTWRPMPRPLDEIIETQVDQEPAWVRFILDRLRSVPPLMFALIQITAIAAIVNVARNRREMAGHPGRESV